MGFFLNRYEGSFGAFDINQIDSLTASQSMPFMSQDGEELIVKHIYENDAYDDHKISFIYTNGNFDLYVYNSDIVITSDSR